MSEGAQNISTTAAPPFWRAPLEFAVHALVGTVIFAIVAGPAIFLEVALDQLEAHHVGILITTVLRLLEYLIFTLDVVLFSVFLLRTAWQTLKNLLPTSSL
jgi:hypothetical protein